MMQQRKKRALIVGAGMGGPLMAVYLARRGFNVEIYELRSFDQVQSPQSNISINMTLAVRGLHALAEVGLYEQVMQLTVPVKGRMIHTNHGKLMFQPYGKNAEEIIYAIKREELHALLLKSTQTFPTITTFLAHQCIHINREEKVVSFLNLATRQRIHRSYDILIGADGVFSTVRQQMHYKERADYQKEYLSWGYKNLTITASDAQTYQLASYVFHMWPRGDQMLMATPNRDGSFACLCVLPIEGPHSFSSLQKEGDISALFQMYFPDALPLMPHLIREFQENPTGHFITTSTSPWFYQDSIVLLGDACHSFVPFYGQGMNASLEDCFVLDRCLQEHSNDFNAAFAQYQCSRKRNTDAMAELSKQNFVEIRAKVRSPFFLLQKYIDLALNRLYPHHWIPLYTLIMHTTTTYCEAIERVKKQERLKKLLLAVLALPLLILLSAGSKKLLCKTSLQRNRRSNQ